MNVHEWKYRISDPTIGRFWQIDPLAEDYVYNGTYNFSENRVIDSAELEGLERIHAADGKFIGQVGTDKSIRVLNEKSDVNAQNLINTAGDKSLSSEERAQAASTLNQNSYFGFESADMAAISFSQNNHGDSQDAVAEIGVAINSVSLTNAEGEHFLGINTVYIWGETVMGESPASGKPANVDMGKAIEKAKNMPGKLAALAHTHYNQNKRTSEFSRGIASLLAGDDVTSKAYNIPVYMSNSSGEVYRGDFHLGETDMKGVIIHQEFSKKFRRKGR